MSKSWFNSSFKNTETFDLPNRLELGELYTLYCNIGTKISVWMGEDIYIGETENSFLEIEVTEEVSRQTSLTIAGWERIEMSGFKITIEKGWTSNRAHKTNISLPEPLRSVGDVKDKLFRDSDGLWKVQRNVGKVVFDGTESWQINTGSQYGDGQRFQTTVKDSLSVQRRSAILSSHFSQQSSELVDKAFQHGSSIFIYPRATVATSVSGLKSWLASNNVTFLYQLETPTIETLSDDLQQKLSNIQSFKDSNYLYTIVDETNILPSNVRDNLKPTLHATFKGGGWYARFKTEQELIKTQEQIDNKADLEYAVGIEESLNDLNVVVEELGIETIKKQLSEYQRFLSTVEGKTLESEARLKELLADDGIIALITTNLENFSHRWNTLEGFVQISGDETDLTISKGSAAMIIDSNSLTFFSNGSEVATITGQYMKIDKTILVSGMHIGRHMWMPLNSNRDYLSLKYIGEASA